MYIQLLKRDFCQLCLVSHNQVYWVYSGLDIYVIVRKKNKNFLFCIGEQPINNTVIVSGEQ